MIRQLFLTGVALAAVACAEHSTDATDGVASAAEVTSDASQETDFREGKWQAMTYSSTGQSTYPCTSTPTGTSLVCVPGHGVPNPYFIFSIVEFEKSDLGVRPIVTDYFKQSEGDGGFSGYTRRCEKNLGDEVHDDGVRVQQCEKPAVGAHPLPDGGFAPNDFGVRVSVTRDASGKIISYSFDDHFHPAGTHYTRID